jgi:tRNA threonylcarbamoyladenosine biosynthesis protein TsaE
MWCEDGGLIFHEVSQDDLNEIALQVIAKAADTKVWLFKGEMGSGKTTFIKVLGAALGVADHMSSPTFSIVNEYLAKDGRKIYHFDFYRIKNEAEAYDIGTEEYFYSGNYCFIEWPEKIRSLIPAERVELVITPENQTHRTIAISVHDR